MRKKEVWKAWNQEQRGLLSPTPSWDSLPLISVPQSTFGQWLNLVSKFSCSIFQQLEIPNICLSKSLELQI